MKSVTIDGRVIRVGDILVSNRKAPAIGLPAGRSVKIAIINKGQDRGAVIGIADDRSNDGWHNLDGLLKSGNGFWLEEKELFRYLKLNRLPESVRIKGDFLFRKKNLKGRKGTLLAALPNCEESMIEFEEFVEGCSCDGLGKAGHCLVVPHNLLEFVETEKAEKGG